MYRHSNYHIQFFFANSLGIWAEEGAREYEETVQQKERNNEGGCFAG